jgi:hypothetical protein
MRTDPKYEEEVSGCTATVGILSKDKIYVVCLPASDMHSHLLTKTGQCR